LLASIAPALRVRVLAGQYSIFPDDTQAAPWPVFAVVRRPSIVRFSSVPADRLGAPPAGAALVPAAAFESVSFLFVALSAPAEDDKVQARPAVSGS